VYFLVVLTRTDSPSRGRPDHEPFIDSLIDDHRVLLGGRLDASTPLAPMAAYVLRCESVGEAERLAATDPLVTSGAAVAVVSRWDLVALDLGAAEEGLLVLE
jgi:uncharacterized protein YciI